MRVPTPGPYDRSQDERAGRLTEPESDRSMKLAEETQGEYHLRLWNEWLPSPWFVYVIQGDEGGPVKVGYTQGVKERIASLQTGNPQELRILHLVPGNRTLEWNLHQRLKAFRVRGEWFAGDGIEEHLEFIEALADWMVEGYRMTGKLPDYRTYGQWFHRPAGRSGDPATSKFVDPATIRPEGWQPRSEPTPEERQASLKETARRHRDSPFNPYVQAIPTFQPHRNS